MSKKKKKRNTKTLRNAEYYDMLKKLDELYSYSKKNAIFDNLYSLISDEQNIMLAYRSLKSNKGSRTPGVNGHNIESLKSMNMEDFISYIKRRLANYTASPVKCVSIPKSKGGTRIISIPTIEDRIILQCIRQVIEPICEAKFHMHSYGFRPLRNTSYAIARIEELICNGYYYTLELDIKKCFDNIDHGILIDQLKEMKITDNHALSIIDKSLKPKQTHARKGVPDKGICQGSPIAPILSNIILDKFDWWFCNEYKFNEGEEKMGYSVRYADDIAIFCKSSKEAVRAYIDVKRWLFNNLSLELQLTKNHLKCLFLKNADVLGFRIKAKLTEGCIKTRTTISKTSIKEIVHTVNNKKCRSTQLISSYRPVPVSCRLFPQNRCIYTKSGRKNIYRKIETYGYILKNLAANPMLDETVEFNDNRLAKYLGQSQRCAVSGVLLNYDDMVIIHIVPKPMGGTDNYNNLIYVTRQIAYYILAPLSHMEEFNNWPFGLKPKQFAKLNRYRIARRNEELSYKHVENEGRIKMEKELNIMKRDVVDAVTNRIIDLSNKDELNIPANYSVRNAIKAAWLILQDLKNKDKKPAYECCSKDNIANALLSMVIQGLDPHKDQCYFIVYGNNLVMRRSYFGSMALAMRVNSDIRAILPEVIYEDDTFEYERNKGRTIITKHTQSLSNINRKKIVGAYCTVVFKDDSEDNEIMNFDEIKQSWTMSSIRVIDDKGQLVPGSNHEKFTAETCKKTVTNRMCKRIINSSDDKMYFTKVNENNAYHSNTNANANDYLSIPSSETDWEQIGEIEENILIANEDDIKKINNDKKDMDQNEDD